MYLQSTSFSIYKWVKLATVIEGDQKAPISIAITPRCATPFLGLLYFTLNRYLIFLSVKQGGINPSLPDHWRTLYPLWSGNYCCSSSMIYIFEELKIVKKGLSWPYFKLHIYVCVYEGHSMNIVNFAPGVGNRKSIVMGPFISQKTISMTFFTDCSADLTFLPWLIVVNLCLTHMYEFFWLRYASPYASHFLL